MPLAITIAPGEDEEANKRRKMLQEALEMDRDNREDESVDKDALADRVKPADNSDDDSDEEHSEDHDETAVLLREVEKHKREGAADQA
jgi:protein CWC15